MKNMISEAVTVNGLEIKLLFAVTDKHDALIQAKKMLLNHYEEAENR